MKEEGDDQFHKPTSETDASGKRLTTSSPQPKMRYRCKLCGQPKQNHTCPYQQSLARSIGVQIYPCVNAFTAAEPGTIAPALSDMNNFVDVKEPGSNESSPSRPSPDRVRRHHGGSGTVTSTTQITPESMRSSPRLHSPPSLIASPTTTTMAAAAAPRTPSRRHGGGGGVGGGVGSMSRGLGQTVAVGGRKRSHGQMNTNGSMMTTMMMMTTSTTMLENESPTTTTDLLFLDAMEIKPEQFRVVSASKAMTLANDAFTYPALPLPYAQRKRLSDNLFSLSNEVPKLTDECAQVLREAREKDLWDLAVAELMTQVVVIIHCPDGDNRFEGLRQYLLTLGIAC